MAKSLEAIIAIDYFRARAREQAQRAASEGGSHAALQPDEPLPARGAIASPYETRPPGASMGHAAATVGRPRVASAWPDPALHRQDASFVWFADVRLPKDAPASTSTGARFTHVGDKVTFEVLLHAFALERDTALQRLGEMVHVLDVGGEPTAEASGFEAVLAGARARIEDDDSLLTEMGNVLDSLYAHFQNCNARR